MAIVLFTGMASMPCQVGLLCEVPLQPPKVCWGVLRFRIWHSLGSGICICATKGNKESPSTDTERSKQMQLECFGHGFGQAN